MCLFSSEKSIVVAAAACAIVCNIAVPACLLLFCTLLRHGWMDMDSIEMDLLLLSSFHLNLTFTMLLLPFNSSFLVSRPTHTVGYNPGRRLHYHHQPSNSSSGNSFDFLRLQHAVFISKNTYQETNYSDFLRRQHAVFIYIEIPTKNAPNSLASKNLAPAHFLLKVIHLLKY
ncbi:hypothetical protein B0T17DRAFT_514093 [Bombardia bombarda]|uniref:Uncharacterized protein n=1 Tax=Bombardia bombarda TaxID=252184 RepID=A0AA39XIM3_9PEZI|nr:hypothetical protein B0T17DRAFT_514093 [Bombardia bombarda]